MDFVHELVRRVAVRGLFAHWRPVPGADGGGVYECGFDTMFGNRNSERVVREDF
jgi:hypothetical protein